MLGHLEKHHAANRVTCPTLVKPSRQLATRAVAVAEKLANRFSFDIRFVEEAAWLCDIDIGRIRAPDIGCSGDRPDLAPGILGRVMLEEEGLYRHALVCERHIVIGLSEQDIIQQSRPLPPGDMLSLTLIEKIITYADLFYSKSAPHGTPKVHSKTSDRAWHATAGTR